MGYLIGSAVACLISIACMAGGVWAIIAKRRQRATYLPGTGTVVALNRRVITPGTNGVYCPTVQFITNSGQPVQFESQFGTMPASHKVGQVVKILYDPNQPDKAEVDSGLSNWLVPGCLLAFTLGSCFFSFMFLGLYFVMSQPT